MLLNYDVEMTLAHSLAGSGYIAIISVAVTGQTTPIWTAIIAVICVTKSRTGDYDFRACARARARGFRGSTFSVGRIRFAVCAELSRDKTCVF